MTIGEIQTAKGLGRKGSGRYIWSACLGCGRRKWVELVKGKPKSLRCRQCVNKTEESRRNKSKLLTGRTWTWKRAKKRVKQVCLNCGQEFETTPSRVRQGRGKFCSRRCSIIYYHKQGIYHKTPNSFEKSIIKLLQANNLPFKYVGDGEVWFGNRNPDFVNVNGKKQIIECLGIYWHPIFDGAQRIEHYKQYGFSTLIIWEDEPKDKVKLLNKIKTFTQRRLK